MSDKTAPPARSRGMSRRTAVKIAAVGLAGAGFGAGSIALATRLGGASPCLYRFFTEKEAALVIELCEQIIPRDDVAGATDAGVIHFIDRQLLGPYARDQQTYRLGLECFTKTCLQLHGESFGQLDSARKVAVMKLVEASKAPAELWKGVGQSVFFRLLLDHTMQGFYGSPRHGGNRDYVSYKILGLDYPQVIGQNRYRKQ